MMCMNWVRRKFQKLTFYDFGLVKTYCFLVGMIAGSYVAVFVQKYVWIFWVAVFTLIAKVCMDIFHKKKRR